MDLNLVRSFVEIVEAGTLSEAARRRNVTRSQMSKELKTLERQVDATLMRRTTRQLALTTSGQTLYEHGVRMLAEMESARSSIDSLGHTVRGHVRLSIPSGLGEAFLGDRLLSFQQMHPAITLRVLFSNRVVDLIGEEVDVAVRVTSDPPPDQVARKLCSIRWGLFAAPSYLATLPPLLAPEDLAGCRMICPPGPEQHFRLVMEREAQVRELRLRPYLQTERVPYLRSAMLAGNGIALLPEYALPSYGLQDDLLAGRAVRVLPSWQPQGLGKALYILTMQDRRPSHAVCVLTDYLREILAPVSRPAGT